MSPSGATAPLGLTVVLAGTSACGDPLPPFAPPRAGDAAAGDGAAGDGAAGDGRPGAGGERVHFEDVTEAAGLGRPRVPAGGWMTLPDRMSGGVCVLDADGVPPLDLFFAFLPSDEDGSRLYVAEGPMRYEDRTAEFGLSEVGEAMGCLAFDADGDGDDDLLVTGAGTIRLFESRDGGFVDRTGLLGVSPDPRDMYASAAAGDLDGDGDLDLVVAGFIRYDVDRVPEGACERPGCADRLDVFEAIPSLLLLRAGDGTYEERATELAPDLARREPTLVVTVSDLDGDRRGDIYVGNDVGFQFRDRPLVRGGDGVYRDASDRLGLAYNNRGWGICTMGFTHGDIDRNGTIDHVATSFEEDATAVFLCREDGWCGDEGREMGMDAGEESFRWGAALGDLDLDGWLDLVEATGHLYEVSPFTGIEGPRDQPPNVYLNELGRWFGRVPPAAGLAQAHSARGIAIADLDDDGLLDVVLAPSLGRPVLLANRSEVTGHWLRVVLRGREPNPGAVGATVEVAGEGFSLLRERTAGEGYLGSFDPRLHFGLPGNAPVDVTVSWPDGSRTHLAGVPVDGEVVVVQGAD